ncbi:hypothetical protein ACFQHO_45380 [Actinomadura yumaensis]|uniref:hypothetical protein n=1 Tax=Actinomadura yumaensis TaxID=111807 RepID=UPI00360AA46B
MTPIARPIVAESRAISRQCSSGSPSMIAMTRAAYGSANSATNSQRSGSRNPSTSSPASAWKRGTSGAIMRRENAGFSRRRSRWWSSPSLLSTQFAHHAANGPPVMPWCAGQRALPCASFGCLSSLPTSS